jgi:hypothetical protein
MSDAVDPELEELEVELEDVALPGAAGSPGELIIEFATSLSWLDESEDAFGPLASAVSTAEVSVL